MKMKIAIIDNAMDPSVYNPTRHWRSHLIWEWKAFRAPQGLFPNLKEGYTHLILTGSEVSILKRDTWVWKEVRLVQKALGQRLPILGSCYGH